MEAKNRTKKNGYYWIVILSICLFIGCSKVTVLNKIDLQNDYSVTYISAHVLKPLNGNSITVIDRYLFNQKTGEVSLVRSDSTDKNSNTNNLFQKLPIPLLP